MSKKKNYVLVAVVILILLLCILIFYPYPFFGPFENPPASSGGNCGPEYRFKVDTKIESADEFIQFLKGHQYEGNLTADYEPTIEKLIPSHASFVTPSNSPIDLDSLKENVTVDTSKAIFSNEKIYTLNIQNDWSKYWPFRLTVKMSETGHISIRHCAGI